MISFGPFKAEHLGQLRVQEAQRWTMAYVTPEILVQLEAQWSTTLFKNGRPILCGGVLPQRPDYGILWSFVGEGTTADDFRRIHYLVKRFIAGLPYRRVEMHVDADFTNGHRWAKALGFSCEASKMEAFLLNGGDAALYARIKRG